MLSLNATVDVCRPAQFDLERTGSPLYKSASRQDLQDRRSQKGPVMRNAKSLAAVCCLMFVVAGCDSFSSSAAGRSGGVAVVDLDEVARQLGADQVLVERINQQETSLNGQLHSLQATLRDQFQQKSQELKAARRQQPGIQHHDDQAATLRPGRAA